jgi:hypothetical protein
MPDAGPLLSLLHESSYFTHGIRGIPVIAMENNHPIRIRK